MKSIIITDKNYRWVFSRLKKFFDHGSFVCWHQWGGGMRKRIGHNIDLHYPGKIKIDKVDVTREYHRAKSEISIIPSSNEPIFRVVLNYDDGFVLIPNRGHSVVFLGNRVIIKRHDKFSNRYLYECYQILK